MPITPNPFQRIIKELEQKSISAEDELSELKSDNETTRINLHLSNQRAKTLSEKQKEMREQIEQLLANQG